MINIAVGDIHGCLVELQKLTDKLSAYQGRPDDVRWIFLGDYVDRGPDVKGVVDFLLKFREENSCVFLKGNHEDMMLDPLDYASWNRNGGKETLASYPDGDMSRHMGFFRSLALSYETETHFFCHAGVHPFYPLDEQNPNDLLWIRQTFLWSDKDFGKIIVHGHTPQSFGEPEEFPNRINIDQGCVFGGRLTAVILEDGKEPWFEQVQSEFEWGEGFLKKKVWK